MRMILVDVSIFGSAPKSRQTSPMRNPALAQDLSSQSIVSLLSAENPVRSVHLATFQLYFFTDQCPNPHLFLFLSQIPNFSPGKLSHRPRPNNIPTLLTRIRILPLPPPSQHASHLSLPPTFHSSHYSLHLHLSFLFNNQKG